MPCAYIFKRLVSHLPRWFRKIQRWYFFQPVSNLSCISYHLPRYYWISTIFYVIDLLIIITKQKKHQLEIHETAIKRGKYLFRGKFNIMSGQMTLKHQLLDNWHEQGVSHFKIHQYTIYIFKPRSFKAPSLWVSVSSKSQSPRLSLSCIQLML